MEFKEGFFVVGARWRFIGTTEEMDGFLDECVRDEIEFASSFDGLSDDKCLLIRGEVWVPHKAQVVTKYKLFGGG